MTGAATPTHGNRAGVPGVAGSDLVMLHGANGCADELDDWQAALGEMFHTQVFDLLGHGGRPLPERFTMAELAADALGRIDALGLDKIALFGYSFGGTLALYLARHFPARIAGIVTLATKAPYDRRTIRQLTHLLQVSRLEGLPKRMTHLTRVHQPNGWREQAARLAADGRPFLTGATF